MKLECCHTDTCLSDYWGGHHLPHVVIPLRPNMTCQDVQNSIRSELWQDAVEDFNPEDDEWFVAACESVDRIEATSEHPFSDIEDVEGVCAYFVFRRVKE